MESSDEDQFESTLSDRAQRMTYLITYSQADLEKFPTRESFAEAVTQEFNVVVSQWACCKENHKNSGVHYHLSIKLSNKKRWKSVKENIYRKHGIVVNFSDKHHNYYSAFRYVTKEDKDFKMSTGHPDLSEIGSPKTNKCVRAHRSKKRKSANNAEAAEATQATPEQPGSRSRSKLSPLDVAVLIADRGYRDPLQLRDLAEEQRLEGKKDLAEFCVNRTNQRLSDLFESAWQLREARSRIEKMNRSRIGVIREAAAKECLPACAGKWYEMAIEVLQKNSIHSVVFAHTIRHLIINGRGKNNNVMLIGPTNTAKTFLFDPLNVLFDCFSNPASNKYAWVDVDKAECILLQDFEFSTELISWKSFLLLLEGQKVNLPTPKNHFAKDVQLSSDIPIFATSGEKIVYYNRFNVVDQRETAMMDSRWNYIELTYQFQREEQITIEPCGTCFAKLVLLGEEQA